MNREVDAYISEHGIIHQTTCVGTGWNPITEWSGGKVKIDTRFTAYNLTNLSTSPPDPDDCLLTADTEIFHFYCRRHKRDYS